MSNISDKDLMKEILNKHHDEYEIFQWSVMNAFGSLIYSEYISKFKQVTVPTNHIKIPSIKSVWEVVDLRGYIMGNLSRRFYDILESSKWLPCLRQFDIFKEDNKKDLETVLITYILKNVEYRLPEAIEKKFGLDKEDQQFFQEDRTIDLFNREFNQEWITEYIVHETILQFMTFGKQFIAVNLHQMSVSHNDTVVMEDKRKPVSVAIDNANSIAPIIVDEELLKNEQAMKLISFVTGSTFTIGEDGIRTDTSPNNILTYYEIEPYAFSEHSRVEIHLMRNEDGEIASDEIKD